MPTYDIPQQNVEAPPNATAQLGAMNYVNSNVPVPQPGKSVEYEVDDAAPAAGGTADATVSEEDEDLKKAIKLSKMKARRDFLDGELLQNGGVRLQKIFLNTTVIIIFACLALIVWAVVSLLNEETGVIAGVLTIIIPAMVVECVCIPSIINGIKVY
eukprot:241572_1